MHWKCGLQKEKEKEYMAGMLQAQALILLLPPKETAMILLLSFRLQKVR